MSDKMDDVHEPESTPAARRRQRVRTAILDAAERVFAAEGEDGLSIRRLADEIDYSPAAIYKYFGSKDELLEELKDAFFERLGTHIDAVRADEGNFELRARRCMRTYIETAIEKPQHYLAAFSGIVPRHGSSPVPMGPNKAKAFAYLSAMVAEGQELGYFTTQHDPISMAKSVWACCHGAATLMAHMPSFPQGGPQSSPLDRSAFIDLHTEILLNGLFKRTPVTSETPKPT